MTVPDKNRRITPAEHLRAQMIAREQRAVERRAQHKQAVAWARERAKYRIPREHPAFAYITKRIGDDIEAGYKIEEPWCYKGRVEIHLARWHEITNRRPGHVVYYIRVSRYIKIGTSNDVDKRLQAYPPDSELLATEPGSYDIEAMRHEQFAKYLSARREWFDPAPELLEHIENLQHAIVSELDNARSVVRNSP